MRIFASKSASIAAIKKKNKQFADWWNRWAARNQRIHLRARKSAGMDGQGTAQGTDAFQFRNLLRLRKILAERGQ